MATISIHHQDNLEFLKSLPDGYVNLIFTDPPFNSGKQMCRKVVKSVLDDSGNVGFGGNKYKTETLSTTSYNDSFGNNYIDGFLRPRMEQAHRILKDNGSMYLLLDYREVHYAKVMMDEIFGRDNFINEVIWHYDYGAKSKSKWSCKHNNILFYAKDKKHYTFNYDKIPRIPYMAPKLAGAEKAALGKIVTDCYDKETEILTNDGWINFSKLTLGHKVATVSPDKELTFVSPSKLHSYKYDGKMIKFNNHTVDLVVTPNHNMYVKYKHDDNYNFIQAKDMNKQMYSFINNVKWVGENKEYFELPDLEVSNKTYCITKCPKIKMEDWCEFLGYYISEGWVLNIPNKKYETFISQTKSTENIEKIKQCIDRCGFKYRYYDGNFVISGKQLVTYLSKFGKAYDKYIPREIMNLDVVFLEKLYNALILGDGHIDKRKTHTYTTTSKKLANDMCELMFKLGNSPSVYTTTSDKLHKLQENQNIKLARKKYVNVPHERYDIRRRASKEAHIFTKKHMSEIDYNDYVYCCTVEPYHTLVVRRNGRVSVCGNCWWHTIVGTVSKEKRGYSTQKPLGILNRIVDVSSNPGDLCMDFFAGSGSFGVACQNLGRDCILVDENPEAIGVMKKYFNK